MAATAFSLDQVHVQQLECLFVLSEELHFGRTADRLRLSQPRVSQLIASLESVVGARLVDRSSRRVVLTRLGEQFVADVRPAVKELTEAFVDARRRATRGALRELHVGFTGTVYEETARTFRSLHADHGVTVHGHDIPPGSPFTAVLGGDIDAVIAELPVYAAELTVAVRFPAQDQFLVVHASHPLAGETTVGIEDLRDVDLVHRLGDAPTYWMAERTPAATPSGCPIASTAGMETIQQGMSRVAAGDHAMLLCRPMIEQLTRRDVRALPVVGMEGTSQIGLIHRSDRAGPELTTLTRLLNATLYGSP